MRICFIGPANSHHIIKWCKYFTEKQHDVHVVSFVAGNIEHVNVHILNSIDISEASDIKKIKYLLFSNKVKRTVDLIAPDIINVHYASSYGAVAALANLKNYILSLWGSDIYEFPNRGSIHRFLLKYSLSKATHLFSTSYAMANEASKYTDREIHITPFGVDLDLFNPQKRNRNDSTFVIGLVKGLSSVYGIHVLLQAYAQVRKELPDITMELRIAGEGEDKASLMRLADNLGISHEIQWLGYISQESAAKEWANMDIAVIPSLEESFGVSAIEAQACGTPLIVSDAPGLLEVTANGKSAMVVARSNVAQLSRAIIELYLNENKRKQMSHIGRVFVEQHYEYNACFNRIESFYKLFTTIKG